MKVKQTTAVDHYRPSVNTNLKSTLKVQWNEMNSRKNYFKQLRI